MAAGDLALSGAGAGTKPLLTGDNALLPWSADLEFVAPDPAIILVTEDFA